MSGKRAALSQKLNTKRKRWDVDVPVVLFEARENRTGLIFVKKYGIRIIIKCIYFQDGRRTHETLSFPEDLLTLS